jgi:hypothetical protein
MGKILDIVMVSLGVKVAETNAVAGMTPELSLPMIFSTLAGVFAGKSAPYFRGHSNHSNIASYN